MASKSSAAPVEWVVIDWTTNNQLGEFGTLAGVGTWHFRFLGRPA